MVKERIDILLVSRFLAPSRQRAQAMIMAGNVLVDDTPVTKAGTRVNTDAAIRIRGEQNPFVSRGGLKLRNAANALEISFKNKVVLDIGASTGGFTDYCLKDGATHVFSVDVGTNQLEWSLRKDQRVTSMEQTNAKQLLPAMFSPMPHCAVIDVSFISITKILSAIVPCIAPGGFVLAMVKPQFELGPEKVGKGGVVRNNADRQLAVNKVISKARRLGLTATGQAESNVPGPKGNRELFVLLQKPTTGELNA